MINATDYRLFIVSTPWDDADKYLDRPLSKRQLLKEIVTLLNDRISSDLAYNLVIGERSMDLQEIVDRIMK